MVKHENETKMNWCRTLIAGVRGVRLYPVRSLSAQGGLEYSLEEVEKVIAAISGELFPAGYHYPAGLRGRKAMQGRQFG